MHCHGALVRASLHSVGHLARCENAQFFEGAKDAYRVQVPESRGRVIPEMASMSEDFPALWLPMTAIWGRSMSTCTLQK